HSRPLLRDLVRGDHAGPLPSLLRRVLRDAALGDDRLGRRDGRARVRGVAGRRTGDVARAAGREALPGPRLEHLPPRRRARALPRAGRPLRPYGAAAGRADVDGRRGLHPRVDPRPRREGGRGLREHHADVQGAGDRGGHPRSDRVHPLAHAGGEGGTMTAAPIVVVPETPENYLTVEYGVRSWLLTTDHKRVGLLYLMAITGAFFVGGFFALGIRLELLTPAGDLMRPETYNKFFSMHGIIMVFFFLVPSIPAVLGNFLLPL